MNQRTELFTLISVCQVATNRNREGLSRIVYAYLNNIIYGVIIYFTKKKKKAKLEIILIIFKSCVSEIYDTVLLPNLKRTYGQIKHID